MDAIPQTEPPLTETELSKWDANVEKLKLKKSLAGRGIKIKLDIDQKIRWIRTRIHKSRSNNKRMSEQRIWDCIELLQQGVSIKQICRQKKVGAQMVCQLRTAMRNGDLYLDTHIDPAGPGPNRTEYSQYPFDPLYMRQKNDTSKPE